MPSARYYRDQAQILLAWASSTNDADYATLLTTRAMDLLAQANGADDIQAPTLSKAINAFNEQQMGPRPTQQQQHAQPKEEAHKK